MTSELADHASTMLQDRCGILTEATLTDGKKIVIHNIAWARDMGAASDHITTNISPRPSVSHTVDFFTTDEVALLIAPESGAVLYSKPAAKA
jgi:hypothetical protein